MASSQVMLLTVVPMEPSELRPRSRPAAIISFPPCRRRWGFRGSSNGWSRTGHGDPVDFGGGKAGPIGQIEDRGGEDHAILVDPGLDLGRLVGPAADQQAM